LEKQCRIFLQLQYRKISVQYTFFRVLHCTITGQGFYEFLKPSEKIQSGKEVILQHKSSGDMFSGKKARQLIGLDPNGSLGIETVKKVNLPVDYKVFVQSTSYNRVLVGDSEFLYKVGDT